MATKPKNTKPAEDEFFEDGDSDLTLNMDEVEAQSFENIPKGTYKAIIEELKFELSKSSGKPMWNVTLVITEGEFTGRKLFTFMSFSEKALPSTKATLQKIAPEVLSAAFNPRKIAAEGTLVGKAVKVKTKIETYEGEDRTRVQQIMADKSGASDFIDA